MLCQNKTCVKVGEVCFIEKFRARTVCFILCPDDENFNKYAECIKNNYDYACIFHDRDINEDTGEIKKPHFHYVVKFSNAKWNSAFSEETSIPINYIQECRKYENALEYLVHFNDDSKIQYPIDEVQGPLKFQLLKLIKRKEKDNDEDIMMAIYGLIQNHLWVQTTTIY